MFKDAPIDPVAEVPLRQERLQGIAGAAYAAQSTSAPSTNDAARQAATENGLAANTSKPNLNRETPEIITDITTTQDTFFNSLRDFPNPKDR